MISSNIEFEWFELNNIMFNSLLNKIRTKLAFKLGPKHVLKNHTSGDEKKPKWYFR